MRPSNLSYKKLVLVCVNERENGESACGQKGSLALHQELKMQIKAIDPTIRVSKSGCLGNCAEGITVVIMPDNKWFSEVTMEDIPELVRLTTNEKNTSYIM